MKVSIWNNLNNIRKTLYLGGFALSTINQKKNDMHKFPKKMFLILVNLIPIIYFLLYVMQWYLLCHDEIMFYFYDFNPKIAMFLQYNFFRTHFTLYVFAINFMVFFLDLFICYVNLDINIGYTPADKQNRLFLRIGMALSFLLFFCYLVSMAGCDPRTSKQYSRLDTFAELNSIYILIGIRFPSFESRLESNSLPQQQDEDVSGMKQEEILNEMCRLGRIKKEVLDRYTFFFDNMQSLNLNLPMFVENGTELGHYYPENNQFYRYGITLNGFLILYPYNHSSHSYSESGKIVHFFHIRPNGSISYDSYPQHMERDLNEKHDMVSDKTNNNAAFEVNQP